MAEDMPLARERSSDEPGARLIFCLTLGVGYVSLRRNR